MFRSDSVLNVEDIRKFAPNLGPDVTYVQVRDGIHDLFLSRKPVRAEAFRLVFDWMERMQGE